MRRAGRLLKKKVEGNLVFLPGAELMMMSGNVFHGGGLRAEARPDDRGAHLCIHFVMYTQEKPGVL